jgi:hypothetical protein
MKKAYFNGAMYAKLEGEQIERVPVELGDGILKPGEFVKKLGEKHRSSFEMQDGYFLRYVGRVGKTILFNVNDFADDDWYYAFEYISPEVLILGSKGGCWDIRISHLQKVENPNFTEPAEPEVEQLELELFSRR